MLWGLCISFNNKALGKCVITSFIRTNAIERGLSYVCPWTRFQLNYISIFFWFIFSAHRSKIDFYELRLRVEGYFWWLIFSEKNANIRHPTILLYLEMIWWNHLRVFCWLLTVDDVINWRLVNDYDYNLIPKCNWNVIMCTRVCICNVLNYCCIHNFVDCIVGGSFNLFTFKQRYAD